MNFGSVETSEVHKLLLNLLEKINLKISDNYDAVSNLGIH